MKHRLLSLVMLVVFFEAVVIGRELFTKQRKTDQSSQNKAFFSMEKRGKEQSLLSFNEETNSLVVKQTWYVSPAEARERFQDVCGRSTEAIPGGLLSRETGRKWEEIFDLCFLWNFLPTAFLVASPTARPIPKSEARASLSAGRQR